MLYEALWAIVPGRGSMAWDIKTPVHGKRHGRWRQADARW